MSLMQARPFPHPWSSWSSFHKAKFFCFPDEQLTSSPALLATSLPQSSETLATENPSTSDWQVWSPPHAYTNKSQAHCSPSAQRSSSTFYLPSRVDNVIFSQQNADPKIEFQSAFWDPVSYQAKSSIRRLRSRSIPLSYRPWLIPTTTTTTDPPTCLDLPTLTSGVLEQSGTALWPI